MVVIFSVFTVPAKMNALATGDAPSPSAATNYINPHFTGRDCDQCHEKVPEPGGDSYLKYGGELSQVCSCHNYTSKNYIHPVDIEPSDEKRANMPASFPLSNGKLSCSTCHDMYLQCKSVPKNSIEDRKFIRGGPYSKRTDMCFKCHDDKKYRKLDPHNQLDARGSIIEEKCLYCHKKRPDESADSFEDVKLVGDLMILCQRCHGELGNHPGNAPHFVKPSTQLMRRIKAIEKVYEIILPRDYEGRLTCITCHNPHERGVIPKERDGAKGASEIYRHRLPKKLCKSCHGF